MAELRVGVSCRCVPLPGSKDQKFIARNKLKLQFQQN